MGNVKTGLDAVLPVEPEVGINNWVLEGWEPKFDGNDTQIVLVLEGMYKTRAMKSNHLLQELRKFEKVNEKLLFKNANGGITYKQKVALTFTYAPNMGGRRFKSAYENVSVKAVGGNPPSSSKDDLGAFV